MVLPGCMYILKHSDLLMITRDSTLPGFKLCIWAQHRCQLGNFVFSHYFSSFSFQKALSSKSRNFPVAISAKATVSPHAAWKALLALSCWVCGRENQQQASWAVLICAVLYFVTQNRAVRCVRGKNKCYFFEGFFLWDRFTYKSQPMSLTYVDDDLPNIVTVVTSGIISSFPFFFFFFCSPWDQSEHLRL